MWVKKACKSSSIWIWALFFYRYFFLIKILFIQISKVSTKTKTMSLFEPVFPTLFGGSPTFGLPLAVHSLIFIFFYVSLSLHCDFILSTCHIFFPKLVILKKAMSLQFTFSAICLQNNSKVILFLRLLPYLISVRLVVQSYRRLYVSAFEKIFLKNWKTTISFAI